MTSKQEQEFNEMLKHYNISVAEDIAGQPDPECTKVKIGERLLDGKVTNVYAGDAQRQHNSESMMAAYPHGPQGDEPQEPEPPRRVVDKAVDNPSHYDVADTTVQKILESFFTHQELMGWIKGNILKYRLRAFRKGKVGMQDIKKADQYQKFYDDYKAENTGSFL